MDGEKKFFVAVDGDDGNAGSEAQTLATLGRARELVRAHRADGGGAATVVVRGGTHYLAEPLTLTPADSGGEAAPISYVAHPGEKPVLSGAVRVQCDWRPYRDGIMRTKLDLSREELAKVDQVFVSGRRRTRARYPNIDPAKRWEDNAMPTGQQDAFPPTEVEFYRGETAFNTDKTWTHPEEAVLHVRWFYGTFVYQLRGIDHERNRFLLGKGGWHWNTRVFEGANYLHFSRCFVDNVFEELDAPGEWYVDKREGVLYYMPLPEEDLATATVEIPLLRQLIEFRGAQDDPVHHVSVSGFKLTHTATVYMEPWQAPSMGDWTIHRSGAVFLEGAADCAVEDSWFHATGGNAALMNNYNVRNRVAGCTFSETGESAVCVVGAERDRLGTARPFPDECVVHNNHMHHLGEYNTQVAGVFLSCCQKITVSHNDIHDVPRAAILVNDPTWSGHVIEYNRMRETCQGSVDHGPFNSWGRTRHWCYNQSHGPDFPSHPPGKIEDDAHFMNELRYNFLEEWRNFGIDMDDGSCRFHIHHNVCLGCPIKFREGTDNLVENNIVIDSALGTRMDTLYENNTDRFVRNIVVLRRDMVLGEGYNVSKEDALRHFYHSMMGPPDGSLIQEMDHNVFWSDLGEFKACVTRRKKAEDEEAVTDVYSLEQWQAAGHDVHSVFADPKFVDIDNGDYRLRPDSPALKLGFESFDLDAAGLMPDFPRHWEHDADAS